MIANLQPYPEYKESGLPWVANVPSHWKLIPNRGIIRKRKVLVGENYSKYRLLSLTKAGVILRDVASGKGKWSSDMRTSQEVRAGDFVFCLFDVPETPRTVGLSPHDGMITGAYTVFECLNPKLAGYFELFYRAMDDRKLLSPLYSGLRHTIPSSRLLGAKTPQPPSEEQAAIVRFLNHVNRRIDRYLRAKKTELTLTTEMLLNVTQCAMQFQNAKTVRLSVAAEIVSRPVTRLPQRSYKPIGLYNRGRGIFHKPITVGAELGDSNFTWLEEGDIVISGQFAWEGAVALARAKDAGCVASHRYPIIRGRPEYAPSAVLLALLRTPYGKLLLDQHSRGAAGRNRPLNDGSFLKEKFRIPPPSEQARITNLLTQEYLLSQAFEKTVQVVSEYQTRLVADVVSGKLDVRAAAKKLPETATIPEEALPETEREKLEEGEAE